jgi:recombinase
VQEQLGLVFQTFLKFRTVSKVMRVLNERGLDLPRRDRHGDLCWARATVSAVSRILQNPAYAGAFVYGRTRPRSLARDGNSPGKMPADSDDVGRAFRLMSATCSDRSRPAVPIDVGRGGGAPAGRM